MTELLLLLAGCTWVTGSELELREDWDGDGFVAEAFGGDDCDDSDASVHPEAPDAWYDGVDSDCDGRSDYDADRDGHDAASGGGGDCDDDAPGVWPGAAEACNGEDDDCDGVVPADESDDDGDGWRLCGIDGEPPDCDDTRADVNPGAQEVCDDSRRDEDCDGAINDGDDSVGEPLLWYQDDDGDGYGDPDTEARACDPPPGYIADATDCDDGDATISPSEDERCDGVDSDCDGVVPGDERDDADGDGVVDCEDCAPDDPTAYPGAVEYCDGVQTDCAVDWDNDRELLSFEGAAGWTALERGSGDDPAEHTLDRAGTLHICEGTHVVRLVAEADLALAPRGLVAPVLSGGEVGPALVIATDGVSVSASGLTFQDGAGEPAELFGDGQLYDFGGAVRCEAAASLTLEAVTFTGNEADYGAGLGLYGCDATLDGVSFTGNSAGAGAGVALFAGASLDQVSATFAGNDATRGAGVYLQGSSLTGADGRYETNTATFGAGLYADAGSDVSLTRPVVAGNSAAFGAGLVAAASQLTVTEGDFADNEALYEGGGVWLTDGADATLTGGSFTDNAAYDGGGLAAQASAASLDGVHFEANDASTGGGVYASVAGALSLADCSFTDNLAIDGAAGGLRAGSLSDSGGAYGLNEATRYGGALWAGAGSEVALDGTALTENVAYAGGGVSLEDASLTAVGAVFQGNDTTDGGGVYAISSSVTLADTEVSDNHAVRLGGGLALEEGSTLSLERGSVASNTADEYGSGGVFMDGGALSASGTTLSGNLGVNGGALFLISLTAALEDVSLLDNIALIDGGGAALWEVELTAAGLDVQGNSAIEGGGLHASVGSTLAIDGGVWTENHADTTHGGAFYLDQSDAALVGVTASDNTCNQQGAGLYASGATLTLDAVTLSENEANILGGALSAYDSALTLSGSAVVRNSDLVGALYLDRATSLEVSDTTFTNNDPGDVYKDSAAYDFGLSASFTCYANGTLCE